MRRFVVSSGGAIALAVLLGLLSSSMQASSYSTASSVTNLSVTSVTRGLAAPATQAVSDGRWKLGGDGSCYWDPDDSGPDQCSQTMGRWKLGGDGTCYFDANDSGANQCAPPAAEPATEARAWSAPAVFRPGV
jgi:hypothetical protein